MSPGPSPAPRAARVVLAAALGGVWLLHAAVHEPSEPFFNNDETRHVMTGVFFRDSLVEGGLLHPREYAESYFLKYPALGLLVWPPFFHAVEGVWFLLTGPSFLAARVLVGLHATIACLYLFLLASRTHGPARAAFAAVLFALAPQTFVYSRQVMLEMPTLTCSLAAFYHFARFVESERRRDILLCAVFSSFAALTRFDGLFLFPACGLLLLGSRRLGLLLRRDVLLSGLLFAALVVPYYAFMAAEVGWYQWKAISEGTTPASTGLFHAKNFRYYLEGLPRQLGPLTLLLALAGLGRGLLPGRLRASLPYIALMAGTYVMVVPVAELEARHAIYWVPAFALFAAEGAAWGGELLGRLTGRPGIASALGAALAAGLAGSLVFTDVREKAPYVRGYGAAARYVVESTTEGPYCLFDGLLNGDFVLQVRTQDPRRSLWVLRGDKLFYSVLSDPHAGYTEFVRTKDELRAELHKYDPELIAVEEPQVHFKLRMAALLREVLREDARDFRLERTFEVESNLPMFRGVRILVYRKLVRNPARAQAVELELLGVRRKVSAPVGGRGGS